MLIGFFKDGDVAWLVNLEAGVLVQLPPGVFFAFPSALLTHWSMNKGDGSHAKTCRDSC